MYSQSSNANNTGFVNLQGSSGRTYGQHLGTGLSGIINEVSLYLDLGAVPTVDLQLLVTQCDNDTVQWNTGNCLNYTEIFKAYFRPSSTSTTQYFIERNQDNTGADGGYGTTGVLDPTKYTYIQITGNGGTVSTRLYGTNSNLWSGGNCDYWFSGSWGNSCGITDLFFILNGVVTAYDTSHTYNLQPAMGSTTVSTQVTTGFQYHAVASQNITSYAMLFYDVTQDSSFTITGTAATGDSTISRIITLTSGHAYNYNAYVCNSTGTCYGGPTVTFSVISSSYSIGTTNTNSITSTSTLLTPTGVGSIIPSPNIIADDNATSSATQGIQSFGNIPALLSNKYPFNWIYDIANSFNNQGTTTSSDSFPDWSIDYGGFNTTYASTSLAKGILPSKFTILSTTTISTYISDSSRELLKNIMRMAMYVGLALQVYYMAVSGKFLPTSA